MAPASGAPWATPAAITALERVLEGAFDPEAPAAYSLRRLFECEAACMVHRQISESRTTEEGVAILEQNAGLWNILHMGEEYHAPMINVAFAFTNGELDDKHLAEALDVYLLVTPWLIDVASSHPPPSMLTATEQDPVLYDPVVRFILLGRAINEMPAAHTSTMMDAFLDGRRDDAERLLLAHCRYAYSAGRDIYQEWAETLEPLASSDDWDAPLFRLRLDAILHRLATGRGKGLFEVVNARTPVQMLVPEAGIRGILIGNQLLDESGDGLKRALMLRSVDSELFNLFHGSGTYRCIYGLAGTCDGRREECTRGLRSVASFPPASDCVVRRDLEGVGYSM